MRTRLLVAVSIAAVVLIATLVVLITQLNKAVFDVSLKLQPLQKWTDDLLIHIDEVPQGWLFAGIQTKSDLGVATRWVWFNNRSANDNNFSEQFIPYSSTQEATNNYQRWVNAVIPPAYAGSWKEASDLEFAHHADQMTIRCLPDEFGHTSHRTCSSIAQYQNLIVVTRAIVYDKGLPPSDFHQILEAMDRRIVRVLARLPESSSATQPADNGALPFDIPTPINLNGGTRILLATANCPTSATDKSDLAVLLDEARQVIETRLDSAHVFDSFVQVKDCQIEIEVPPVADLPSLIDLIQKTGHFELVDNGSDFYPAGTILRTTGNPSPTVPLSPSVQSAIPDIVYKTIVTGADLDTDALMVQLASNNSVQLSFTLKGEAVQTFAQFTAAHNETTNGGEPYYICIAFDNVVQSCPSVRSEIPNGQGVVTVGDGGVKEANRLLNLFQSGALPLELHVVETDTIR